MYNINKSKPTKDIINILLRKPMNKNKDRKEKSIPK